MTVQTLICRKAQPVMQHKIHACATQAEASYLAAMARVFVARRQYDRAIKMQRRAAITYAQARYRLGMYE